MAGGTSQFGGYIGVAITTHAVLPATLGASTAPTVTPIQIVARPTIRRVRKPGGVGRSDAAEGLPVEQSAWSVGYQCTQPTRSSGRFAGMPGEEKTVSAVLVT